MQILDLKFFVDFNLHFSKEINSEDSFILCKDAKVLKTSEVLRDHIWININNLIFTDPNCYYGTILGTYVTGSANIEVKAKNGKYIVNKFLVKTISKSFSILDLGFQRYSDIYIRELLRIDCKIFYIVIVDNDAKIIEYYAGETKFRPELQKIRSSLSHMNSNDVKYLINFERALTLRIKNEIHTETIQALA